MKKILYLVSIVLLVSGCKGNNDEADAWGNFEAREIMISAESSGRILLLPVEKGQELEAGNLIAITDTMMIKLQMAELNARALSIKSKLPPVDANNRIIDQQIDNLEINISRIENMLRDEAATQKQLDDLTGQREVLLKQKEANNIQKTVIGSELSVVNANLDLLAEKLSKCRVICPGKGTVLEKYSEAGEITSPGKPLIKIADLSSMELKVYIDGGQLASVTLNQKVKVRIDDGDKDYSSFEGLVSHISDKAEFTPKIIQTKEERVHMVYAVTIMVNNDGSIKSGMPGEVIF
jgi:HlyD family secretion protein